MLGWADLQKTMDLSLDPKKKDLLPHKPVRRVEEDPSVVRYFIALFYFTTIFLELLHAE